MDYLKKSRIEEVLIAILDKGTVTSQLISRIEKILDAIRVNGSYDGIAMSEVEEILICILRGERFEKPTHSRIAAMLKVKANGGEYTELRKSRVEELIFEWINAVESATYTGTLPTTLRTVEGYLESYKIYGNTEQTGTPTPSDPIEPSECGERTENLFSSTWENGNINSTTGQNETSGTVCRTKDYIPVTPNTIYSMKRSIYTSYTNVRFYRADKTYIGSGSSSTINIIVGSRASNPMLDGVEFCVFELIDTDIAYMRINDASNNVNTRYMMVEGQYTSSTMPTYIPYGYKLPILSNSTVTDIYLGESPTTRRIKKLMLTGKENFDKNVTSSSNYLYYSFRNNLLPDSIEKTTLICNELPVINGAPVSQIGIGSNNNFNVIYVNFGADVMNTQPSGNTVAGLKEYLAQQYANGTPVTIWYVLAEPETGIVNEPLMKIGDYADIIDSTQSTVQIPTAAGETTISWAGEGLAPSEVELAYTKTK